LVECGARTKLWHAAALGLMSRVEADFADQPTRTSDDITVAFYQACAGGQRETAEYLLGRGADINWIPNWGSNKKTPLDVARDHDSAINRGPPAESLVEWLISRGAKSAAELGACLVACL
jgi:hypothetical protein